MRRVAFLFALTTAPALAGGDAATGKTLYTTCTTCHGADGAGMQALNAPNLTTLQGWYIERQLNSFKSGLRGTDAKDTYGMQMRPMAMTLSSAQAVADVVAYIDTLPEVASSVTVAGDAAKGKTLYTVCTTCHGADGAGMQALNAPALAGQSGAYLSRQLEHFRSGVRGSDAKDVYGSQMKPMAMTLPDEQAIADVVAYINTL